MAERPVFLPQEASGELVREAYVFLTWSAGFASVQKKKNILALHEAAAREGYAPLLDHTGDVPSRRISLFSS
jgi:hypothetical protein